MPLTRHGADGDVSDETAAEIAALYYQQNVTQEELSQRYASSRAKIGRLLKRAREQGIVRIRVLQHPSVSADLEREYKRRFGLSRLLVAIDQTDEATQRAALGGLVASYLPDVLAAGMIVAVGMGRNVEAVVSNTFDPPRRAVTFVAAMGGSVAGLEINADHISRRFASVFGGDSETLYVPAYVASQELRAELLQNDTVKLTLDRARRAEVAIIGIGDLGENCNALRRGWASATEVAMARAEGTVGEINGNDFLDVHGRPTALNLRGRMVGVTLGELARIPNVIAVASGRSKTAAILGALRTGAINTLATSTTNAVEVLEMDDTTRAK